MKRTLMLLPLAGLLAATSLAQPPDGRKGPSTERTAAVREAKVDPKVEEWIKLLAEKITDPHDEIRDGARAGLVAAGRSALPRLQQLSTGDDSAKASAARKLMEAIETGEQQRRRMLAGAMPEQPRTETAKAEGTRPNAERPNDPNRPVDGKPGDGKPRPGPDGRPPNPFEGIVNDLKLSEKQEKQAHEVMEEFRDNMNRLRKQVEEEKLTRDEAKPKRDEVQQAMMRDMKEILGDKFAAFEEAMRNMPKPGPRGERGEGPKPPKE